MVCGANSLRGLRLLRVGWCGSTAENLSLYFTELCEHRRENFSLDDFFYEETFKTLGVEHLSDALDYSLYRRGK